MKKGDSVKVKKGVFSPDYDDLLIEGWQGRVTEISPNTITFELDSITLDGLSKDYITDSFVEEVEFTELCLDIDDVELTKPRDSHAETINKQNEINSRYSINEEENRILDVLKSSDSSLTDKNQKTYLKFLSENLQKPCILSGMQDFEWEEPYLFGGWSQKEYKKLKMTQPSYTDLFEFINVCNEIDDWKGIIIKVKRLSDEKQFNLPLWDLKVVDEKSPNYLLVSDYSSWMTNYQ
jgi:hypothetical protein